MGTMSGDPVAKTYLFGPFRLEVRERRLLRDGAPVPLLGKAFDTLVVLVEGAGALQRQHALMDQLWPDASVEQNNLQQNVSLVRRALGSVDGVEIETNDSGWSQDARASALQAFGSAAKVAAKRRSRA